MIGTLQRKLRMSVENITDLFPVNEIFTVHYRKSRKISKCRITKIVIIADRADRRIRIETRQKYLTVPAAIRELEKIEMVRCNNGSYKLDHAVTKTQKIILSSFGLDETDIRRDSEIFSKQLTNSQSFISKEEPDDGEEEIN